MILYTSSTSPYGRKVRMAAHLIGREQDIECVEPVLSDENGPLRLHNPLGKMPCLLLDNGQAIFDSRVIIDYFDALSGGMLFPRDADERIRCLVQQALADGITDAAMAMGSERRFRPEEHVSEKWLSHQRGKVLRGLAEFARDLPGLAPVDPGGLALAASLGYLDWRKPVDWRGEYPGLVGWLDAFRAAVPCYDGPTPA